MSSGRETSEVLKTNMPEILERWEARAVHEISAAHGKDSLVLVNALPNFLEALVVALTSQDESAALIATDQASLLKMTQEHGRSRAALQPYTMSQLITEYHVLREVLFQVLKEKKARFDLGQRELLTAMFEEAVNVAATEFALVLREIQDHLLLSIAHDLKSPVTATQAGAELIRRSSGSEVTVSLADRMLQSMKQMTGLIEKILDTKRLERGEKLEFPRDECDVDAIIRDIIVDMRLVYGGRFEFHSEGQTIGLWNSEFLRRMIENLVSNAAKYHRPESPVTITLRRSNAEATIEVHNLGNPISETDQAELFLNPRWRKAGRTEKGWGLGLVLAKGIAEALGGAIGVESSEVRGTTFTVTLPRRAGFGEAAFGR